MTPGEPADLAASLAPPPEAVAGRPCGSSTLILHPNGDRLWRRIEYWPLRDQKDALLGLLGQIRGPEATPSVPDSQGHHLRQQLMALRERLHGDFGADALIGTGPEHARLMRQVRLAADTDLPVLIVGDHGTGKRLVARVIHHLGPARSSPLVSLDCAALPSEVLRRELFLSDRRLGDLPDSRPTAEIDPMPPRPDLRLPPGSTLLLTEILALPRDLQAALAASLNGSVRLIATTSGNPEAALEADQLPPELYFRLTTLVLRLPPLRERKSDLALLAQHLLERANRQSGTLCGGFTPQAMLALESYDWPGNVAEVARVVGSAQAHLSASARSEQLVPLIDVEDLPTSIRGNLGAAYLPPAPESLKPLDELLTEIERRLIESAMAKARQNKSRAAEILGISRPRLYRRIKELNLPDESEPETDAVTAASPTPT